MERVKEKSVKSMFRDRLRGPVSTRLAESPAGSGGVLQLRSMEGWDVRVAA
jgi:hypothetical protein